MKKFNKTNNKLLIVMAAVAMILFIGLDGCNDVLDQHLYSSTPVNEYYKSATQVRTALNHIYANYYDNASKEWEFKLTSAPTFMLLPSNGHNKFTDFNWLVTGNAFEFVWTWTYKPINMANTLLDALSDNENIPEDKKKDLTGKAKFIRALYYFRLVKRFGGVPLMKHGTTDLSNIKEPRSSAEEVYKFIEDELKDARSDMKPYSESDHGDGLSTSWAAAGLLVKVYAQEKKWDDAAKLAKDIINNSPFGLLDDVAKVLDPDNYPNKEIIYGVPHGPNMPNISVIGNQLTELVTPHDFQSGGNTITFTDYPGRDGGSLHVNEDFFNNSPATYRRSVTFTNEWPWYMLKSDHKIVHSSITTPRPYLKKLVYLNPGGESPNSAVCNPVVLYSNILLIYAESLNEKNGGPTPEAYDAINAVRERARGVGTSHAQPASVYPDLSGLDQDQFRNSVLTEMQRELIGVGETRAELLRHDRFIQNAIDHGKNAEDYQKVYPIPSEELERNENLKQNPGY
jgi:hypothetical protein